MRPLVKHPSEIHLRKNGQHLRFKIKAAASHGIAETNDREQG